MIIGLIVGASVLAVNSLTQAAPTLSPFSIQHINGPMFLRSGSNPVTFTLTSPDNRFGILSARINPSIFTVEVNKVLVEVIPRAVSQNRTLGIGVNAIPFTIQIDTPAQFFTGANFTVVPTWTHYDPVTNSTSTVTG